MYSILLDAPVRHSYWSESWRLVNTVAASDGPPGRSEALALMAAARHVQGVGCGSCATCMIHWRATALKG